MVGSKENSESLTLGGNSPTISSLDFSTTDRDSTIYRLKIQNEGGEDSIIINLEQGVKVDITGDNAPLTRGETYEIDFRATNYDADQDHQFSLFVGPEFEQQKTVTLPAGESVDATFTWPTDIGDVGEYVLRVAGQTDSGVTSATVEGLGCVDGSLTNISKEDNAVGDSNITCSSNFSYDDDSSSVLLDGVGSHKPFGGTFQTTGTGAISEARIESWMYIDETSIGGVNTGFFFHFVDQSNYLHPMIHDVGSVSNDPVKFGVFLISTDDPINSPNSSTDELDQLPNQTVAFSFTEQDMQQIWFKFSLDVVDTPDSSRFKFTPRIKFADNDQGLPQSYEEPGSVIAPSATDQGLVGIAKSSTNAAEHHVYYDQPIVFP